MGEYAFRKSDKKEVKIGTCETMYYLRWDNRNDIVYPHNWLDVSFRLPFPDEDSVPIGEYVEYNRCIPLINYSPISELDNGRLVLSHVSGVQINVPCYHGCAADIDEDMFQPVTTWPHAKVQPSFSLMRVKQSQDFNKLCPVIKCNWCDYAYYSSTWQDILPFITDDILLNRLVKYSEVDVTSLCE
jgi:hypothetical protein